MAETNYWDRIATGRVSRRSLVRGAGVGVAGLAGAALIGCGSKKDTPAATATAAAPVAVTAAPSAKQPKRGGTFRLGFTGTIAGIDAHNSVYGGAGGVPQVYNFLFRREVLRGDLGLKYDLAKSHQVEKDGVTWTFKLRTDAKIAPNDKGVPERVLDSEDVVQSFKRMADKASAANGYAFFATWVDKFDAPDKETVRLVTKKPYAWVEENLGDNLKGAIVPKEWLAKPAADFKQWAVGAGPFMLKSMQEGEGIRMVRNPNFYDKERPYLDGYDVLAFKDVATQRTALSSGQIDSYLTADPQEAKDLQKATKGLKLVETGSTAYNSFWMRVDGAPWKDARVRRALNLSMNRDEYIQIIGKGLGKHMGPVAPVFGDYALPDAELKKLQPYDVAEAKKLFEAAGVKELAFTHPTSSTMPDYVNIMVKQLQAIGVTAKPQPLDAAAWVAQYFGNGLTASYSLNQSYKTPDFALAWYRTGGVTGSGNYATQLYSPEIDTLIDKAAATIPEAERKAAYLDAQRAIMKTDPAFVNVFNQGSNVLYYEKVQNFDAGAGAMTATMTRNYWLDV